MKMKYIISAQFNGQVFEASTNDYLMAWAIYSHACEIFPEDAVIDLVDARTAEVFQTSNNF